MLERTRAVEMGSEMMEAQQVAEQVTFRERLERLMRIAKDPQVKTGLEALLRTGLNVGISGADALPVGVGESFSWTADACKLLAAQFNLNILDVSPDVSKKIALGTEVFEPLMGGNFQSHLVETVLQLQADWPRMKLAVQKALDHWRGVRSEIEQEDVQEAMRVFQQ